MILFRHNSANQSAHESDDHFLLTYLFYLGWGLIPDMLVYAVSARASDRIKVFLHMAKVGLARFLSYLGLVFLICMTALWDPSKTLYK